MRLFGPAFALARLYAKRLARDRFLLGASIYVFGAWLAVGQLLPSAEDFVQARFGSPLEPWLPLLASYLCAGSGPLLAGIIFGFLLLETRESGVDRALGVTPLPRSWVVGSSFVWAGLGGAALTALSGLLVGAALPPVGGLLAVAGLGGLAAMVAAAVIAQGADNQVEAFAVLKALNLLTLAPALAWLWPGPIELLAGLSPFYWPAKVWWLAEAGEPWIGWAAGGCVALALMLGVSLRRLSRR